MPGFEQDVRRILLENGCTFVRRGNGDHEIWYSPVTHRKLPRRREDQAEAHRQWHHEAGGNRSPLLKATLLRRLAPELQFRQPPIEPTLGDEFAMRSLLDDLPLIHNENAVGLLHGR